MAKKNPPKKGVGKKNFNLDDFMNNEGLNSTSSDDSLSWIPLSKAWHDGVKLPGFPRGYVSLVRGFSNTGKSTAFYEAIAGAQKIGDLPVVIETEGNWNAEHAQKVGVKFKEVVDTDTGEITLAPDGFILIRNQDLYARYKNYCHKESKMKTKATRNQPVIEDVALFIEEMIQKQTDGDLDANLCFLWDSIGTLNGYQSATANGRNNQWNAGAMNCFGTIVNFLLPASRSTDSEYTNTLICVQKIWLDAMGMGQPVVKHKGGEFMYFNSRIIVHIGGSQSHGTKALKATSLGQEFQYGTEAKIKCVKNHVNGITKAGKIASTPTGYVNPDELDAWKKEHRQLIHDALNVDYDAQIDFSEEDGVLEGDDIKE
jgi:hypothetical protein